MDPARRRYRHPIPPPHTTTPQYRRQPRPAIPHRRATPTHPTTRPRLCRPGLPTTRQQIRIRPHPGIPTRPPPPTAAQYAHTTTTSKPKPAGHSTNPNQDNSPGTHPSAKPTTAKANQSSTHYPHHTNKTPTRPHFDKRARRKESTEPTYPPGRPARLVPQPPLQYQGVSGGSMPAE